MTDGTTSLLNIRTTLRRFSMRLCDVPFHSVRACVLVRSFIDRSRPFGTLWGDAAECSGGVYDERWWLNELLRALSLPGNQIRSSSFLDQTPINDIDPFYEVTMSKIISLSTRACTRTHTSIHLYIYLYQSRCIPQTYVASCVSDFTDSFLVSLTQMRARLRLFFQKISWMQLWFHLE